VADILLEGKLGPKPPSLTAAPGVTASAAELQQVAGVYRNPKNDGAWPFTVKDGKLMLNAFGVPLAPLGDRKFTAFGMLVEFLGPTNLPPTSVRASFNGQLQDSMVRVPTFTPTTAALRAFAGDYYSDDLGVVYSIALKGDSALELHRPKADPMLLAPLYEDAFGADGNVVRFVRSKSAIDGFKLTGGRVRGVVFSRGDPRVPKAVRPRAGPVEHQQ
jgi:hypothetical protein